MAQRHMEACVMDLIVPFIAFGCFLWVAFAFMVWSNDE